MLNKLKKLKGRSFRELKTRGAQSLSAFAEQYGLGENLPGSDARFWRLFDKSYFRGEKPTAELLLKDFQNHRQSRFFASLDNPAQTAAQFRQIFGDAAVDRIIEQAELAREGVFNLLGYEKLDFGVPVDWHLEPLAGKRSPLKHWKKFDELDSVETGDKKIVWELNRHQHFFALGAAYLLTGEEKFAATFVMNLCGWMEHNPPQKGINWFSSLEAGFRAMSWLWALHFFKHSPNLSPTVFADALKFLYAHGRHIEKYLSTYYSPNTHLTGEALALHSLGVLLPQLSCANRWRETGARILLEELDRQLLADGVYFEQATWYHRYTIDFYTHFLILSRLNNENFQAGEFDKLKTKLQSALDFLMYATRPDGTTPFIGDDDGGRLLPVGGAKPDDFRACLATGAVLFGRGDYKIAARSFAEETFWLLGAEGLENFNHVQSSASAETSAYFPDGGYLAMRDDWTQKSNFFLIDGGHHGAPGGGHAHADALSFELAVAGRTTLVDPGTYTYHESEELRNYFRSTAAHNSLVIDRQSSSEPRHKFAWSAIADAQTESCLIHPSFNFFQASHHGFSRLAPDDEPITHTRSVLYLKHNYWILRDEVQINGRHDYQLNFHFAPDAHPSISDDLTFIFNPPSSRAANGLKLQVFGDNGGFNIREDWGSNCFAAKTAAQTVEFNAKGTGRQEFFTFLLPSGDAPEKLSVKEISARGGRGFVIDFNGHRDWFIYGDGEAVENDLFSSNFRFAWARLDLATLELSALVLINGNKFVFNEDEIVNLPQSASYLYGRLENGELKLEKG